MHEQEWLADQFETYRSHLRSVAYRMLGSTSEADDAVQEAWLHLSRSDTGGVENLGGWLTTVVARVCLDMLRSRKSRREEPLDLQSSDPLLHHEDTLDPEHQVLMADSVGLALLVVLEKLAPAERLAFVLHDMFGVSFDEIAPVVGRTPTAARQLASRARRRVRGTEEVPEADHTRQREVVKAFLAASRGGNFTALLTILDPDVVVRADLTTVETGAAPEVRGVEAVAAYFQGRARAARLSMVDGAVGVVWAMHGQPRVIFEFTITGDKIAAINLISDPERLANLEWMPLDE